MKTITDAACGDGYTQAATIFYQWPSSGGAFDVDNQPVFVETIFGDPRNNDWSPEFKKGVGTGYSLPPGCSAVRFRNATAGKVATVNAAIAGDQDALASGGYPQQAASSMITGIIPATGTTPTAGTGFTYTHTNGTGVYVFTFTNAFAATPDIQVTLDGTTAGFVPQAYVSAMSPTGFTVQTEWYNTGSGLIIGDLPFSFLAQAVA